MWNQMDNWKWVKYELICKNNVLKVTLPDRTILSAMIIFLGQEVSGHLRQLRTKLINRAAKSELSATQRKIQWMSSGSFHNTLSSPLLRLIKNYHEHRWTFIFRSWIPWQVLNSPTLSRQSRWNPCFSPSGFWLRALETSSMFSLSKFLCIRHRLRRSYLHIYYLELNFSRQFIIK